VAKDPSVKYFDNSTNSLAYPQFFGLIPSFFWSFRAWIIGKRWFAIVSHSKYDIALITPYCLSGEFSCNDDIYSVLGWAIYVSPLLVINYLLYRRRVRKLKYKIAIMTILSIVYILGFLFPILVSSTPQLLQ